MWSSRPSTPRTVGDVLRRPVSGRCASSRPPSSHCGAAEERPTFLTEADTPSPLPPLMPPSALHRTPSRLRSAPGPRRNPDLLHETVLPFQSARCSSARPMPVRSAARTRRPVDEALFCALRMEGEDAVAAQLRQLGPERLTSDFRSLCSRLSMHHVTAAQFTFLCAAVLNTTVSQRDCEVVFAFLRAEQSAGSLDVADLLLRLRTLFVSADVLCALQLKRMLETNALSECTVSMEELHKAYAGLHRLLEPGAVRQQVDAQWRSLHGELSRIHVQYAVLVPTFRVTARRLAPTLCSTVQALHWDGSWTQHSVENGEATMQFSEAASQQPLISPSAKSPPSSSSSLWLPSPHDTAAPSRSATPTPPLPPTAVLATVAELYRSRLAEQDAAAQAQALASDTFSAAVSRRAGRRSTWRASNSAVDVTNPHFVADVYATGRVVCSRE